MLSASDVGSGAELIESVAVVVAVVVSEAVVVDEAVVVVVVVVVVAVVVVVVVVVVAEVCSASVCEVETDESEESTASLTELSEETSEQPAQQEIAIIDAARQSDNVIFLFIIYLPLDKAAPYSDSRLFFIPSAFSPTAENVHIVNSTSVIPLSFIKSGA